MQAITPQDIIEYSKCPKKLYFSLSYKEKMISPRFEFQIISDVIKSVYLYALRKEKFTPWNLIPGWVDRAANNFTIDLSDIERYKKSENILVRLSYWYNNIYLAQENLSGFINVPIYYPIDYHRVYYDKIDILEIGQQVRILDFTEEDIGPVNLYKEMLIHIKSWGLNVSCKSKPDKYVRLVIKPLSIKIVEISVTNDMIKKAEKISYHILSGIKNQIFYPSITKQCPSCPYMDLCEI